MTAAPPAYVPGSSPPSYDEVAKRLENLVGSNPTPEKVLESVTKLSDEEVDILAEGADSNWPLDTDKQKAEFEIGCGQTLSSNDGKSYMQEESVDTTQATISIRNLFTRLHGKISRIDQVHHANFGPEIVRLQNIYHSILAESRDFATRISTQAQNFDRQIVRFCADDSLPVQTRKTLISTYMTTINGFEGDASGLTNRFSGLTSDFSSFVTSFSEWAKDREGELTQEIEALERDLEELHQRIARLEESMARYEAVTEAASPVAQGLAILFPKLAPFILLGGLIASGVSFVVIGGLAASISRTNSRIARVTAEKERLEQELESIRETRAALESFGGHGLTQFSTATGVLTGTWGQTLNDAQGIFDWLDKGGDRTHRPQYMDLNQLHRVQKFESVSVFLDNYARGVTTTLEGLE